MIVVNFATKAYKVGQQRLKASLNGHPNLMFSSYGEIGSPTHSESPYEFKIHAIHKAGKKDPIVFWADASLIRVGDVKKIEQIILRDGYYLEEAGHYVGRWCNKHTREYFGITDQEAIQGPNGMTMFSAGCVGFDLRSTVANDFLTQWLESAKAGCFRGDWVDHRHDMTAGSIIAQRMGLTYQRGGSHVAYIGPGYSSPEKGVVFHCQGA